MCEPIICNESETASSHRISSEVYSSDEYTCDDPLVEDLQKKFLNMIKLCDVSSVTELLENHGDFDFNCKDYQGYTGLTLAIQANCEQMVDLLLSRSGLDIGDSLMHAIRENSYSIVIKLLDILQKQCPESVYIGCENSTEFPAHLTPLVLAAQCGHFKIIRLLLKQGHTIQIPHEPKCLCKEVSVQVDYRQKYPMLMMRSVFMCLGVQIDGTTK